MLLEKTKEYFITRYSLVPDSQIDLASLAGVTKEQKFYNWISSFSEQKRIDTICRGKNYTLYCNKLSDESFFITFAKELTQTIGEKTETGIIDKEIKNYQKCNILVNIPNQWMIIEKCSEISSKIEHQTNIIASVIGIFLEAFDLCFELNILTEENNFWHYVSQHKDTITDVDITLVSPNFLGAIKTVTEFLNATKDKYNTTSIDLHLKNNDGKLKIDSNNEFLKDVVKYSSAGGGKWKIKSSADKKGYSNMENPFIISLPDELSQLKDSDLQAIEGAYAKAKHFDSEHRR